MLSSTGQDSRRTICDQGRGPEQASVFAGKVFLCILLACLSGTISHPHDGQPWLRIGGGLERSYLGWFAHFLPNDFPFVGIVLFDGGQQRGALLAHQLTVTTAYLESRTRLGTGYLLRLRRTRRSACPEGGWSGHE